MKRLQAYAMGLLLWCVVAATAAPAAEPVATLVKSDGVTARLESLAAGKPGVKVSFEQAGPGDGFVWVEMPVRAPAQPDAVRALTCPFAVKGAPASAGLGCSLVQAEGSEWWTCNAVPVTGAGWARARFALPCFARTPAPGSDPPRHGEVPSPERVARVRIGLLWKGPARGTILLGEAAWADAPNRPPIPLTLGRGTGGEGIWRAEGAAHSPTSLTLDEGAGPEGTPAAVVSHEFASGKYNYYWATVATDHLDTGGYAAVRFTYRTEVPGDFPPMNVMVRESGGATYWIPEALPLSPRHFTTVTLPLTRFAVPAWSKDPNGKLDEDRIEAVGLGFATGAGGKGRILVSDVVLVPPGW